MTLNCIDRINGEYITSTPPQNMTEIAMLLQGAQICYDEVTVRVIKTSKWKESIEAKMAENAMKIGVIKSVINTKNPEEKFYLRHIDI